MLKKINRQFSIFNFQFSIIWLLVIGLLVYSRFINLGWGLPYPMHPDERNMANAIQQLNCKFINLKDCFNPHFFAYGQFPLYLAYLLTWALKGFKNFGSLAIGLQEAVLSLRIISAAASVINALILLKILKIFNFQFSFFNKFSSASWRIIFQLFYLLMLIFSPYAIQFAHFGTTESLLMLFYSVIIYYSLLFVDKKIDTLSFVINCSTLVGLSMATKVSSLLFLIVPLSTLMFKNEFFEEKASVTISKNYLYFFMYRFMNKIIDIAIFIFLSLVIFLIFSPHNLINFNDFVSSMNYESEVALGKSLVFYTRQFANSASFIFQLNKVFPYVMGWPVFIMGLIGLIVTDWKDKKINLLRFAFLIYFIPSAMIYAKWSRFMAPVLPIISIFAIIFISKIKDQISKIHIKYQNFCILICNFAFCFLIFAMIIPGFAYLNIYRNPDVRFQASDWIYKNIPNNSYILSETANVVDIPTSNGTMEQSNNYSVISFNFYDLDQSPELQLDLRNHLEKADYIFVSSRRIFANHTCYKNDKLQITNNNSITNNKCQILKQEYPNLNKYYEDLFSGKLGFEEVAKFDSFPKIRLFGQTLIEFPDEQAEETWTVFDHPVIRIYKKIK